MSEKRNITKEDVFLEAIGLTDFTVLGGPRNRNHQ